MVIPVAYRARRARWAAELGQAARERLADGDTAEASRLYGLYLKESPHDAAAHAAYATLMRDEADLPGTGRKQREAALNAITLLIPCPVSGAAGWRTLSCGRGCPAGEAGGSTVQRLADAGKSSSKSPQQLLAVAVLREASLDRSVEKYLHRARALVADHELDDARQVLLEAQKRGLDRRHLDAEDRRRLGEIEVALGIPGPNS